MCTEVFAVDISVDQTTSNPEENLLWVTEWHPWTSALLFLLSHFGWPENDGSFSAGERLSWQPCERQFILRGTLIQTQRKSHLTLLFGVADMCWWHTRGCRPDHPASSVALLKVLLLAQQVPGVPAGYGVDTGDVNSYWGNTFFQILEAALFQRHFGGMQICLSRFCCRMRGRNRSKWFVHTFPSCLLSGLETKLGSRRLKGT